MQTVANWSWLSCDRTFDYGRFRCVYESDSLATASQLMVNVVRYTSQQLRRRRLRRWRRRQRQCTPMAKPHSHFSPTVYSSFELQVESIRIPLLLFHLIFLFFLFFLWYFLFFRFALSWFTNVSVVIVEVEFRRFIIFHKFRIVNFCFVNRFAVYNALNSLFCWSEFCVSHSMCVCVCVDRSLACSHSDFEFSEYGIGFQWNHSICACEQLWTIRIRIQ